jgi:hypothetical protein
MDTDQLIEDLARGLEPVTPLRSPLVRALQWLAVVASVGGVLILRFANFDALSRMTAPRVMVECVATLLTAVAAIVAAFELSVPGRSPRWALLPAAPFLLWLAASGLGCLQNGLGGSAHESMHCFLFIAAVSVPLAASLLLMLRRARPIAPLPVAVLGALGAAATAVFVLEFFHPFDVTVIDLALHLAAVALVIGVLTLFRRPLLTSAPE